MGYFNYRNNQLFVEEVPVAEIACQWGTPCYIYSRAALEQHWRVFDEAFSDYSHLICYAVKANSNIAVLDILAQLGSGFDIVSGGELERVLAVHGDPQKIVFSGVGKLEWEIKRALEVGIKCFNVESASELKRINQIAARLNKVAPISIRVNPDVNTKTHPYIATGLKENKFGINIGDVILLYKEAKSMVNISVIGVDCHIGSQLTELAPLLEALDSLIALIDELEKEGICITHIDIGGGLGVRYKDESPPSPKEYISAVLKRLKGEKIEIIIEPGRAIAANAGILVMCVEYLKLTKHKNFAVVDAGMNDLLRPALYQAEQEIVLVNLHENVETHVYDVVGPICETGDFLAKNRRLAINEGDFLAIRTAGAYGFTMSSNYNSRPRPAELLVDGKRTHVIRPRETVAELFAKEQVVS